MAVCAPERQKLNRYLLDTFNEKPIGRKREQVEKTIFLWYNKLIQFKERLPFASVRRFSGKPVSLIHRFPQWEMRGERFDTITVMITAQSKESIP